MPGYGWDSWVSEKDETTYGTDPGAAGRLYGRLIREAVKVNPNPTFRPGLAGPGRRKKYMGRFDPRGPIRIETNYEGLIGKFLKHAFGQVTTTGAGADKTHTYAMATALPTGMNLEISKGDVPTTKVFRIDGAKIQALTLEFEGGRELELEIEIIAKDRVTNVARSGAPTYPIDEPILFSNAGNMTIAGTSGIKIKSGRFRLQEGLQEDSFFLGAKRSEPKRATWRDIMGNAVLEFEDLSLVDKFALGTEGASSIVFTSANNIPTTAVPYSLTLTWTSSFLAEGDPEVNAEGQLELPVSFQSIGGNTEASAVLVNGEAGY